MMGQDYKDVITLDGGLKYLWKPSAKETAAELKIDMAGFKKLKRDVDFFNKKSRKIDIIYILYEKLYKKYTNIETKLKEVQQELKQMRSE